MTKRMLIDAAHPEETRVVLLDGQQLENFDVEVSSRRQLKGNIYLAKVIRVEPSLQAAFVDYGGNRHGFLAFSEIHPDYYQIPISDRAEPAQADQPDAVVEDAPSDGDTPEDKTSTEDTQSATTDDATDGPDDTDANDADDTTGQEPAPVDDATDAANDTAKNDVVETLGGDDTDVSDEDIDVIEEPQIKPRQHNPRQYKIQEVIKRRQVLLIQVVKEERGNKGAALTTYMSLAGRYCVLMPNTSRGGGISRKITNSADRKQLKEILSSLSIPAGMAVILRTAGIGRTKAEIKRDFEYLIRLWNNVRDLTLKSTAPTLVHEEGDIVRRSIRDLYSRDIEEVQVVGDAAYRSAKEFMKLLIPSHARRVKQYKETDAPLLRHFGVESQLDAMHNPIVNLPSGGYLVINPTEALVSVDVNSGKSTKERNIEETALKTNLEAADALARQLRLRDLAGLIVIDFIDMDIHRNNAQVERRMKDALKHDRARIQVGRISPFGLLEMSRQRLRPSLIETSSEPCPYCAGTGIRRSTESTALVVLRAVDEEGSKKSCSELTVHVPTAVALYILNYKRDTLAELELKHGLRVVLANDDSLIPPDLRLERTQNSNGEVISEMVAAQRPDVVEDPGRKRRRRRGGRKRGTSDNNAQTETATETETPNGAEAETNETADDEGKSKRRRRSRRGGRRRRRGNGEDTSPESSSETSTTETSSSESQGETQTEPKGEAATANASPNAPVETPTEQTGTNGDDATGEAKPKRRRPRRRRKPADSGVVAENKSTDVDVKKNDTPTESAPTKSAPTDDAPSEAKPKPRRTRSRSPKKEAPKPASSPTDTKPTDTKPKEIKKTETAPEKPKAVAPGVTVNGEVKEKPKRKGWWNIG